MTLLVLDLKVPEIPQALVAPQLPQRLLELWPKLLSYILSFVILGIYWVGHHNQFHYIKRSDRLLLWINILFLMFVAFIPFSAALIGAYADQPLSVAIYGGNLVLVGAVLYLNWWYATAAHRLVDPDIDPRLVRMAARRILIAPVVYLMAIAASVVNTRLSIVLYVLVPVIYILPGRIDRHWTRRRTGSAVTDRTGAS